MVTFWAREIKGPDTRCNIARNIARNGWIPSCIHPKICCAQYCAPYCSSRISSYFCNIARNKFLRVSTICSISCNSVTQISVFSQWNLTFKFNRWPNFKCPIPSTTMFWSEKYWTLLSTTAQKMWFTFFTVQCSPHILHCQLNTPSLLKYSLNSSRMNFALRLWLLFSFNASSFFAKRRHFGLRDVNIIAWELGNRWSSIARNGARNVATV